MTKQVDDWQMGCKDIRTRMITLYQLDSWSDCVFLFGTDKLVPSHKLVLAAASPVFATMFFGGMPEGSSPIRVDDIQPDSFIAMLKYIYTDNIDIGSFEDACALYYAANKYMLSHLQRQCMDYLLHNLTATHCFLAYEFAQMFNESNLINACEELMKTKTMEVLTNDGFLSASLDTIHFLYSTDEIDTSELELFEALERYVAARNDNSGDSDKKNNETEDSKQEEPKNVSPADGHKEKKHCLAQTIQFKKNYLRNLNIIFKDQSIDTPHTDKKQVTIHDIVKLIRFLTMDPQEFASGPATSSLLTQSEILAILININDAETNVSMPEGFSTSRTKRGNDIINKNIRLRLQCVIFNHDYRLQKLIKNVIISVVNDYQSVSIAPSFQTFHLKVCVHLVNWSLLHMKSL
ncbi:hypothetical protein ABMA28_005306 [Loxostege sticticalis]|uniref:BTB domain-containing protein n=1 Tax=Loxostege sticticalis TaxID=481309 RepID=A0ABD0SQ27_LOXSC